MASKKKKGGKQTNDARERGGFKASRHGTGKRASAGGPKHAQKRAAEERERSGGQHTTHETSQFLRGGRIEPRRIDGTETVAELIDGVFLAYNSARLREACQLFTSRMLESDVTIGMTLTGALTPAGLGVAALIPRIEPGFGDGVASAGASLFHDAHFRAGVRSQHGI